MRALTDFLFPRVPVHSGTLAVSVLVWGMAGLDCVEMVVGGGEHLGVRTV